MVLHIGLHKTGTTYLQSLWRVNRGALDEQGVHYPGGGDEPRQRMAAYDLLGRRPGGTGDRRVPGQWRALTQAVASSKQPTVLLSEEALSVATAKQAAACVEAFRGRQVDVLVTVRDLGRVLVSAWQEDIKNDRTWTWQEFVDAVKDPAARSRNPARGFWRAQDLPAILGVWQRVVPPTRLHLVTVPPRGAAPDLLVRRVASVVGFDPGALTVDAPSTNASLGVAGTELVRRLNNALEHRLNQRQHSHLVNHTIVPFLVDHAADPGYGLPAGELAWVSDEAKRIVDFVAAGGYQITGDLSDLEPQAPTGARNPDDVNDKELLNAAMLALQGVSEPYVRKWWRNRKDDTAVVTLDSRTARLASSGRNLSYRFRRSAAELADRNRLAAHAMGAYLRRQRP